MVISTSDWIFVNMGQLKLNPSSIKIMIVKDSRKSMPKAMISHSPNIANSLD
ncbi:hypothetical protein L461_00265 [Klebsiella pneumoniae BIDMC 25]|nr:hypothetical protein L461_00265 [Klebsiella pneumoniae BIDMC 25]KDM21861.1 hypothetical protein AE15_00278 [Klebsiella pneumoniae UCI 56]OUI16715.1 hypothetical protein AZZ73_000276 [Klebsiella pneumoniae]SLQ66972.1 Uncharacterised protein [Klebsiella quasipneumoniae]CAE6294139.1 hypothetical protein AI2709V1_3913 [Klebsiella pneumoniae]